jgi:hypothetical protein
MADLLLRVDFKDVSFETLTDNERDAIRNEIYPMYNKFEDDDCDETSYNNIYIERCGFLDTNLEPVQLPRNVHTICPKHPNFLNKHVQFRFKIESESRQQTETRNSFFDSNSNSNSRSARISSHSRISSR